MRKKAEEMEQMYFCSIVKDKYPHLIMNTDLSGVRLNIREAVKVKRMRTSNGFPDVVFYEPVGCWHGLFIEMKASGEKILTKAGRLYSDEHILEQAAIQRLLQTKGYAACFAIGLEAALKALELYLDDQWHRAREHPQIIIPPER